MLEVVNVVENQGPFRPVATKPRGRVCDEPGCNTVLSVYNHDERCCAHRIEAEPEVKRRRRRG